MAQAVWVQIETLSSAQHSPPATLLKQGCGRGRQGYGSVRRPDDFLNRYSSKPSIEETDDLAADVAFPGLLVSEDSLVGGDDEVAELPGGEDVAGPLLKLSEGDVVAGRDDAALVDAPDQLHHDLLAAVVVDDLELTDVVVPLHDAEELEQHLGAGPEQHLLLALALSVDHAPESARQDVHLHHVAANNDIILIKCHPPHLPIHPHPLSMLQHNFIMETVFRAPKETGIEFNKHPSTSFPPRPIFEATQMRNSLSPRKGRANKKFYHFFNQNTQSIRRLEEEASPLGQLEGLIKQSGSMLQNEKRRLNDLLFPSTQAICEAQIVNFPCIEVKKISEGPIRNEIKRRKDLTEMRRGTLQQIRKSGVRTTLLDNGNKSESHQNLRKVSQMSKPSEPKSTMIPSINPAKQNRTADDSNSISPPLSLSPPKANNAQSLLKLEVVPTEKTYKKGYLAYQNGAEEYWKKIKEAVKREPVMARLEARGVTAKRYYVFDLEAMRPVVFKQAHQMVQIASLTKIMTGFLAIVACQKYDTHPKYWTYRVPDRVAGHPGTTAQLEAGDLLNGQDLLHGLMLPSGNDASICLAELVGKIIQKHRKKEQNKTYFQTFMAHMNLFSKQLGLQQQWRNSSGLSYNPNYSTAQAIVALTALAMRNPLFRKVVGRKEYTVDIKNDRYGLVKRKTWKNTNKLLDQPGWQGVKTGTTDTAGHCLMSKKDNLLIAVFECQTLSKRFTDSVKIYDILSSKQ